VHAVKWIDPFQIRDVPSNRCFVLLQNLHQLILFCLLQGDANYDWFVEASSMMMNQVDSSSFDNDKVDDKKPKE